MTATIENDNINGRFCLSQPERELCAICGCRSLERYFGFDQQLLPLSTEPCSERNLEMPAGREYRCRKCSYRFDR